MQVNTINGILFGFCAVLIWSVAPSLLKLIVTDLDVTFYLGLRFLISTLVFIPFVKLKWSDLKKCSPQTLIGFSVIVALNFSLQAYALKDIPTSWYIVLFSMAPIITLVGTKQKWSLNTLICILFCLLGTVFFIRPNELVKLPLLPFLYLFASLFVWVGITKYTLKLQSNFSDAQISQMMNYLGSILFFPLLFLKFPTIVASHLTGIAYIALLAVLLPIAFLFYSISLRGSPRFAVMSVYLEPVFGCLIAYFLLGDHIDSIQWLGIASILLGLAWPSLKFPKGKNV